MVDDASTDATADVVAEMAEADPRIRLIRLETNGGAYAARNAGAGRGDAASSSPARTPTTGRTPTGCAARPSTCGRIPT